MIRYVVFISSLLLFAQNLMANESIQGSWVVNKLEVVQGEKVRTVAREKIGVFLFTPKRYALAYSLSPSPRKPFNILAKPTDEEIIAGFRSIVFNTGQYQLKNGELHIVADLAKVPGFETGKQFYRVELNKNNLVLEFFDEIYPDGNRPSWQGKMTLKLHMKKE